MNIKITDTQKHHAPCSHLHIFIYERTMIVTVHVQFRIVYLCYASFYLYFMHERTHARTFAKCFRCVYHSSHFYRSIIYLHVMMTQPTIHILRDFNTFSFKIHKIGELLARDICESVPVKHTFTRNLRINVEKA